VRDSVRQTGKLVIQVAGVRVNNEVRDSRFGHRPAEEHSNVNTFWYIQIAEAHFLWRTGPDYHVHAAALGQQFLDLIWRSS